MAGSHEVRGSIPLGSTTDPRGARRRRRAPLFCFLAHRPIGRKRVSFRGVGAGRRPFLVRPDSPAPFERLGGKRVPAAHVGIARPGRLRAPAPRARRPRRIRSGASRRSATGRGRIRRQRVREPRHRRPAGGARRPEAPLPRGRPVRRRGHRARQRDPEEGARPSAGVRRPRPAPPRARPMRPAAQRGDGAFGAGLHEPRGVRECGIVPVKNAQLAVAC